MAEPISIQQLKDASEDAISLAEFINKPENAMIPRRLSSEIHSLQYYLEYMKSFAQRSYETYDEMVANASNLSENVSVFITNDSDNSKNGIYTFNGTSFIKGEYQPENVAKDFVEDKLGGLEVFDGKVRAQDVSTSDGSTQDNKNAEFRNELDALPFDGGVLADTFLTVTSNSKISEPVNQRALTDAMLGNTYYAKLNGFKAEVGFDNSPAWNALSPKLTNGDIVIFEHGKFRFSEVMEIEKSIQMLGKSKNFSNGTIFDFYNQTNGVIRKYPYITLKDIAIIGTQVSTPLDPHNEVFGNVGLLDVTYTNPSNPSDTIVSGYNNLQDVIIRKFDTARLVMPTGDAVWAGAYRDNYNVWMQANKIGAVHLDGATDEKYYGGIISANTEIGVISSAKSSYNNIKFIGTTIENNGQNNPIAPHSSSLGYANATKRCCNIYSSGKSNVYLIGSYNEATLNIAEDGGSITKIGSYDHRDAVDISTNGNITYQAGNLGDRYNIPFYHALYSWFIPSNVGSRTQVVRNSAYDKKATTIVVAKKALPDVGDKTGFAANIPVNGFVLKEDVLGFDFSLDFDCASGLNNNPDLALSLDIYLVANDASTTRVRTFTAEQLKVELNRKNISTFIPIDTVSGKTVTGLRVIVDFTSSTPLATTEDLRLNIYDMKFGFYSKKELALKMSYNDRGRTDAKPLNLTATDEGYLYEDWQEEVQYIWSRDGWRPVARGLFRGFTSAFTSKASKVNTYNKYRGVLAFNTTNNKYYIASDKEVLSPWLAIDGSDTLTPI